MKNLKYILTLLLIIIPIKVSALNGYTIESYDVDIKVNEDNTYDIEETITADFSAYKHGIIRDIPTRNEVERLDGTTTVNNARITNLKVNEKYSVNRSSNKYSIKIGDANKTIIGEKTYKIKYTYNIGNDTLKDMDEFYFNIIGDHWDTTISDITFRIEMPDDFDETKLGFSSGSYGSTINDDIFYEVNDNVIEGYYDGELNSYQGLTVRLELEDGYFKEQPMSKNVILLFILPIIFLVISIYFWYKYGKDDQVIETIEFYPPEGFNSLEVGFLYSGNAGTEDVTSLLIYLANKGYLQIVESDKKALFSKVNSYKIVKLKDYDGDNISEELFFKGLFNKKDTVTENDLYDRFYITMNKILRNINNKENKSKIFENNYKKVQVAMIIFIIAIFGLITIPPVMKFGESGLLLFALIFPGFGFGAILVSLLINSKNKPALSLRLFFFIWGLGFGGIPWCIMVLPLLKIEIIYLYITIVGIISIVGICLCIKYLPKRNQYGNEMLGKIKGFKNFLETAEKEKLEAMVNQNPTYFYDILPYTYVLGVSDKWISKFESIALQAPDWYNGTSTFDTRSFGTFMNNTVTNASRVMSSSPSSSSGGGGSSGGGFSGGGSGGGGGSSW